MKTPLAGKTALVTGGTRGIGAAIARRLEADGARVWITGVSPRPAGFGSMIYRAVDLSNREAAEAFATEVGQGDFDLLVNNAGINTNNPFSAIRTSDYDSIQEVNVRSVFRLCQAVLPGMRRKQWGRIVNIASIFSVISKEHRATYSASKFALDGLTTGLAAEVAAEGILANCVSPGFIETDLTRKNLGEAGIRELVARVPMRRLGQPEEVAALVAWLAGPENTFVSGQNIVIDGGFTRV
ncbi:MAG TPA: SDR family oxidoreductase [Lacunisphaera sp.]|nr:SDR family oxidoreductase [Lacunisphaera sp.]